MPIIVDVNLSGFCMFADFLSDYPTFADANGQIICLKDVPKTVHGNDGLLCATLSLDKKNIFIGGEDGKIKSLDMNGNDKTIAHVPHKWISCIAAGPSGSVAYGANKATYFIDTYGKTFKREHLHTVEGLAFAPKGMRLAASHYNGASVFFPSIDTVLLLLEWKGAHNNICFSPDGRYIITSMQENALHGWRLNDGKHMRMNGYPSKIKSWSWSFKGHYLATSGAEAAILWPFIGKDGPMGKAPLELGLRSSMKVTAVACHPSESICAIGYSDGVIMLSLFENNKQIILRSEGNSALTCLNWDKRGLRLVFGSESGEAGIIHM